MEGGFPNKARFLTSPARRYYSERNQLRTLVKNYETRNIAKVLPFYLGMNLVETGLFLVLRRYGGGMGHLKSPHHNVVHLRCPSHTHSAVCGIRRRTRLTISHIQHGSTLTPPSSTAW